MLHTLRRTVQTVQSRNGAALLYILFISVVFGIVLSFILSTITYGQQNLRRYEAQQQAEYRTEGAFEVALKLMESYVDPGDAENKGIYYFLLQQAAGHPSDDPLFVLAIDGSEVNIGVELQQTGDQMIEARIFDLQRPQLKRILRVSANSDGDDDEVPRYEEGVPVFQPEDGTIYEDFDGDYNLVSHDQLLLGSFQTTGRLVITASSPPIDVRDNRDIDFDADKGIYVGTDMSTRNYKSITLHTSNGHIYIGEDSKVETSNHMLLQADTGHIVSENAAYVSNSYGSITFDAGNYISLVNVTIHSSRDIHFNAKHIYLENVKFTTASNGTIHLNAEQSVTIKNSELHSSNLVQITAMNGMLTVQDSKLISTSHAPINLAATLDTNLNGSTLQSSGFVNVQSGGHIYAENTKMSSPSWTDINLTAAGGISLAGADLRASRDLLLTVGSASQTVDITGAYLQDRNNEARVAPSGAAMTGTPVYGCVSNGVTQICS